MGSWLSDIVAQVRALPRPRQLVLAVAAVGSLSFLAWLSLGMGTDEYRGLYRGLAEEEAARVADALRDENIPYRLEDGGTAIAVPAPQVPEARIRMAGRGLPGGGATGFELFDRPAFGVTDFVHRVNYGRAVQGELARSIEQLEPVLRARVQVVIPERSSVLAARERAPRASVVVKLVPGRQLDATQAKAVVHLVASSVESLDPKDVTLVDQTGRLLSPLGEGGEEQLQVGGAPSSYQTRLEADLADRVEAILEPVVGPAGVVARVRAEMDWTRSEVTEERFDPDSQVARSEQRTEERETDPAEGGVPGVAANTGDAGPAPVLDTPAGSSRVSETYNYEISKVVSHRTTPMGRVQRLSVAVLVDSSHGGGPAAPGTPEGTGDGADDGDAAPDRIFTPEQIQRFEELAMQAVGFSEERGDRITVTAAPFRAPELRIEDRAPWLDGDTLLFLGKVLGIVAQLAALGLFAAFIVRPMLRAVSEGASKVQLPASVSSLEAELAGAAGGQAAVSAPRQPPSLAEQVGAEAQVRAEDSLTTIRNWLNQG